MVWSNTGLLTTQIITNKSVGLYVQYFRMELLNAELVSFLSCYEYAQSKIMHKLSSDCECK